MHALLASHPEAAVQWSSVGAAAAQLSGGSTAGVVRFGWSF
jgi:hypothetical protein